MKDDSIPPVHTPTGQLFKCGCCYGIFDEYLARFDTELDCAVCSDCDRNLKWAKAWMKQEYVDIRPCVPTHHPRFVCR